MATALQLLVSIGAAIACYLLWSRGGTLPGELSLLHGPAGVAIGVAGAFLALAAKPALRRSLVIVWLCIWFTAGLAELRSSAITDGIVVGGIIPYSDANNFLREASRLIEGHNLSAWGSDRPLSDSYLAGQLYMAREHVVLALALAGLFSAVAVGLAAVEVRKYMGLLGATLWTWLILVYYRRYLGQMLSEHAGVAFGALAVALLLRAFTSNSTRCLWTGLFILSLALNARAGALIILPLLIGAVTWQWRRSGRIRILILASISVASAFAMSFCVFRLAGARGGRLMSDYHDVMYGIVFRGNWQLAASEIPNYARMEESARTAEIDRRIVAALKANPLLLWHGAERNWSDFFTRSKAGLGPFSFFMHLNTEYMLLSLSAIGLLCSLGLWDRLSPLILATGLGIVLSVPFVPTPDADRMRAYAATMPFMFLIPAISFLRCRVWVGRLAGGMSHSRQTSAQIANDPTGEHCWLNYCTLPYLAAMLVLPLFARFLVPISPAVLLKQTAQGEQLTLDLTRATWIELTSSSDSRTPHPQRISAEEFDQRIFGTFRAFYPKQTVFLESISRPGIALVCPGSSDTAFLAIDASHLKEKGPRVVIPGREYSADPSYSPSFLENSISLQVTARTRLPRQSVPR